MRTFELLATSRLRPSTPGSKLVAALPKDRVQAMIDAMLLAGLRRCEVLGLRRRRLFRRAAPTQANAPVFQLTTS